MPQFPEVLPLLMFAAVAAFFIFSIWRRGGLKGAIFNATIVQSFGQVVGSGRSMVNTKLKIHLLERESEQLIGLEYVATSIASYQMMPISLSPMEAKKLVNAIELALSKVQ